LDYQLLCVFDIIRVKALNNEFQTACHCCYALSFNMAYLPERATCSYPLDVMVYTALHDSSLLCLLYYVLCFKYYVLSFLNFRFCCYGNRNIASSFNAVIALGESCGNQYSVIVNTTVTNLLNTFLSNGQCSQPCSNNRCSSGSTCVPNVGSNAFGYTCHCLPGYTGQFCDTGNTICLVIPFLCDTRRI